MKKKFARPRKMRDEEADTEGTWAISYGDMVTLLLTFFILFFSLNPNAKSTEEQKQAAAQEKKEKALQAALLESLNGLSSKNKITELATQDTHNGNKQADELPTNEGNKQTQNGATSAKTSDGSKEAQDNVFNGGNKPVQGNAVTNETGNETSTSPNNEKNLKEENLSAAIDSQNKKQTAGAANEVLDSSEGKIYKKGQKIIIDFPGVSFFKSGQVPLTNKGKETLTKFTEKYTSYMGNFLLSVQAYADTKKVRDNPNNKFSDNLELSALRGIAAMRFLQSTGIPLHRMRVAGYGELQLTMNDLTTLATEEQTQANLLNLARRVVLVIEPGEHNP